MQVQVYFMGDARLIVAGKELRIAKAKLRALLFYLLHEEEVDRGEVSSIFWPGKDALHAKASLRNSLYELRALLGVDLFSASTRERVALSSRLVLWRDVDLLIERDQGDRSMEQASSVFLDSMELRGNEGFELWLATLREAYHMITVHYCNTRLEQALAQGDRERILLLCRKLLMLEPYNEDSLRRLMQYLFEQRQHNEALAVYEEMKKRLKEDLAVAPESATEQLARFILSRKQLGPEGPASPFERSGPMVALQEAFSPFAQGADYQSVLLLGEEGSGAAEVARSFAQRSCDRFLHLRLEPEHLEDPALISSWDKEWEPELRGGNPLEILVIENAQFLHVSARRRLLAEFGSKEPRRFFILTAPPDALDPFLSGSLGSLVPSLRIIDVPLLSLEEVSSFVHHSLPGRRLGEEEAQSMYEKTGGNLLLLQESLQKKGQERELLFRLFRSLTPKQLQLLEATSVFDEGFTDAMARDLLPDQEGILADLLTLYRRGLLEERGELLFARYEVLRQRIYETLPGFYRRSLHELAARSAMKLPLSARSMARYEAYHWNLAGKKRLALAAFLRELEAALDFYDPLFPAKVSLEDVPKEFHQDQILVAQRLEAIGREVLTLNASAEDQEVRSLYLTLEYLRGRSLIAGGNREEGIEHIARMMQEASHHGDSLRLFQGAVEYVHYGIQKEDPELMGRYTTFAREVLEKASWGADVFLRAEVLRLEALFQETLGRHKESLAVLARAVRLLEDAPSRSLGFLSLAGIKNYKGRALEGLGQYEKARAAYEESIALVEGKVHKCLDILYADYGRFLWRFGTPEDAISALERAIEEYAILGTHWKRPATEAILGLLMLKEGDVKSARAHLVNAQIYHKADRRKHEEALIEELNAALSTS
ncbi:hypothetical protein ABB02_00091 [Clostridiaceae bacterium JG1575]|nr:hypothetical protein ABB02_00091 [Clostridiaceae bacterium JG1575]